MTDLLAEAHHDGSARHVEPGPYALGDRIAVRIRVPDEAGADAVVLRSTPDAEPLHRELRVDRREPGATWWVGELELVNPVTSYRFALEGRGATTWVNGAGSWPHDVTDAADFRVTTHAAPPAWLADTVGYQIFPDRFARSAGSSARPAPDWAIPAAWDDPVDPRPGTTVRQWYGGDLGGVEAHLDHLVALGVDLIYLTPFFPSRSSHRYDATTFDHVDPLLGGDTALSSLVAAAHRRGIRVVGDLTLNHTGDHHDWFRRAQADATAPEAGFYMFRAHPGDYVAWYDVPSLPKLDHRDAELRRRLTDGPGSVVGRWLRPPFALDGWRIDCANTTARYADTDLNLDLARAVRATIAAEHGDAWLVAEHCYDATTDLDGSGWHGVMAYQWFTRPLAQWLGDVAHLRMMSVRDLPNLDAAATVRAMRTLAAGVPWPSYTASMTLLDSHDTMRFRTIVGDDRDRHVAAMAALLTFPGVPTVFAGSEYGVPGDTVDTGRHPFPWDGPRDEAMLAATRDLIALRHASHALRHGGLRFVHTGPASITYLRESVDERVLVHLVGRAGADPVRIATGRLACGTGRPATLFGGDAHVDGDELVLPADVGATVVRLEG